MPREKGEEWKHVAVLSNGNSSNSVKMTCVYCDKEFTGGTDRNSHHQATSANFLLFVNASPKASFLLHFITSV